MTFPIKDMLQALNAQRLCVRLFLPGARTAGVRFGKIPTDFGMTATSGRAQYLFQRVSRRPHNFC
jgi:hypothetical protein